MRSTYLLLLPVACLALSACGGARKAAKKQSYMTSAYNDIKVALNEADVKLLKDTVKVVFDNKLLFDFASATIKPQNYAAFERFAEALNHHGKTKILITGYTDAIGSDENNNALSLRRADSARNLLAAYQVKKNRMFTWGLGSKHPLASNSTEEGRKLNRRCEFIILYNYEK
jgi:outer membrane protein OmpA-like peptidoglycan-associated protein